MALHVGQGGGGVGGTFTLIVTVAETEPKLLVAVSVYVVVCAGETSCVPTRPTDPGCGVILTVVAFSTCQTSVEV